MTAVRNKKRHSRANDECYSTVSNYMVMFMRMVTSAQIQTRAAEYEPFVIHPDLGEKMGVKEFCQTIVEILGREAGERRRTSLSWFARDDLKTKLESHRSRTSDRNIGGAQS